ncbi:MAG: hypothetical protein WC777_00675 [Candidatus Gracilibacteria bacterium]|jgi:hypothetical protein
MKKNLFKLAAFSGLVSLISSVPLTLLVEAKGGSYFPEFNLGPLIFLSIVSYALFLSGFIYLGQIQNSKVTAVSSFLLILVNISYDLLVYLPKISTYPSKLDEYPSAYIAFGITYGLLTILHGYSLIQLKNPMGGLTKKTGWVELIFGFSFVTVVLSPISLLLLIPMYLLQVKLLLRARK